MNLTNKQYIYQRCHGKDFIDPQLFFFESLTQSFAETALKWIYNLHWCMCTYIYILYMWMLMHHWFHVIDSLCLIPFFSFFPHILIVHAWSRRNWCCAGHWRSAERCRPVHPWFFPSFRGFETTTNILLMEEILHQLLPVRSLSHYLQGFIHSRWFFGISSINM